jgi:hypothetical protein
MVQKGVNSVKTANFYLIPTSCEDVKHTIGCAARSRHRRSVAGSDVGVWSSLEVHGKNGSSRSAEEGQGLPLVPLTSTDHDVPYPDGCRRPDNQTRPSRKEKGSRAGQFGTSWVSSLRLSTQLQQQCRR